MRATSRSSAEARRVGGLHAHRLPLADIQLGGRAREPHRAFDHARSGSRVAHLEAHARAAQQRDLRARHDQRQRVRAAGSPVKYATPRSSESTVMRWPVERRV